MYYSLNLYISLQQITTCYRKIYYSNKIINIAEHLSTRQLILHCVSIGVYIYIYIYIYPSHFNCVGINGEGHTLVLYVRSILSIVGLKPLLTGTCGFIHSVSASRDQPSSQSTSAALTSVPAYTYS